MLRLFVVHICFLCLCQADKQRLGPVNKIDDWSSSLSQVVQDVFYDQELLEYERKSEDYGQCTDLPGHTCVHFTQCDHTGYWDSTLPSYDNFDIRFGEDISEHSSCPQETDVCCKIRLGKFKSFNLTYMLMLPFQIQNVHLVGRRGMNHVIILLHLTTG